MRTLRFLIATVTVLLFPPRSSLAQTAGGVPPPRPSLASERFHLQEVPFRQAVRLLCERFQVLLTMDPEVPDRRVSLSVVGGDFDYLLGQIVPQGSSPGVAVETRNDGEKRELIIRRFASEGPVEPFTLLVYQLHLQFQSPTLLADEILQAGLLPQGITTFSPLDRDSCLLVRGDYDAVEEVKRLVSMLDSIPAHLEVRLGVRGRGIDGRALSLQSEGQTLSGSDLLIDEQTPLDGRPTRLAVKVRPVLQAGGGVVVESDWDFTLNLGTVKAEPVRIQRRVKTRSHLTPGEETTISRLDLAPWGGKGALQFWLRVDRAAPKRGAEHTVQGLTRNMD